MKVGYSIWRAPRRFLTEEQFVSFCQETVERLAHRCGPDGFSTIVEYVRDDGGILLKSISDWQSSIAEQVEFDVETVYLSDLIWSGLPE